MVKKRYYQKEFTDVSETKVYIWEPKTNNFNDRGHAAIEIDSDKYWSTYISISPVRLSKDEARKQGIHDDSALGRVYQQPIRELPSKDEDFEKRGIPKGENTITLTWLNTDKMCDVWQYTNPVDNEKYDYIKINCANVCKYLLLYGSEYSQAAAEICPKHSGIRFFLDLKRQYVESSLARRMRNLAWNLKVTGLDTVGWVTEGVPPHLVTDDAGFSPSDLHHVASILKYYQEVGYVWTNNF